MSNNVIEVKVGKTICAKKIRCHSNVIEGKVLKTMCAEKFRCHSNVIEGKVGKELYVPKILGVTAMSFQSISVF